MLCKISQKEKDKHCMLSLTCRIFKKSNKLVNIKKNKQTHILENKLVVTKEKKGKKMGVGIKRYKLLCIKFKS